MIFLVASSFWLGEKKKKNTTEENTLIFIAQDYLSNLHAVLSFN